MHQLISKKNRVIVYLVFLILLSTTNNKNLKNENNYSMIIDQIKVAGLSNTDNFQLLNKLNNFLYKNILFLRKEEINEIISKYNVIEEYNVKKIYPSILEIHIKPTKFIAKISDNNQLLVGANGKLIVAQWNNRKLPFIFGKFNSKEFLNFKKDVEYSQFVFKNLKSIFVHSSGRWDILTNEDILIKLPKNNLLKSLNLAHKIIIDNKFKDNKVIDLRISNHLIVQ